MIMFSFLCFINSLLFILLLGIKKVNLFYFHAPYVSVFLGVIVFVVLGIPIDYYLYNGRYSDNYWIVFLYSSIIFFGLIVGLVFSWHLSQEKKPNKIVWSVSEKEINAYRFVYILGFCLTLLLYYRMPEIPLFAVNVHEARIKSLIGLGYNYKIGIYSLYAGTFALTYYYFSKSSFLKACLITFLSFAIILPTANRIDALFVLLMTGMAFIYTRLVYKRSLSKLYFQFIALGIVVLIFSSVLQYIRHHGLEAFANASAKEIYKFSLGGFFHRFWVQLENLSYLVDRHVVVEKFSTFTNDILMAVPGSGINETSGVLLKKAAKLEFIGGGITPTFIGEGLVQFGYFGAAIYIFTLGFFVGLFTPWLIKKFGPATSYFPFLFIGAFFLHGIATSTLFAVFIHSIAPVLIVMFVFSLIKRISILGDTNLSVAS